MPADARSDRPPTTAPLTSDAPARGRPRRTGRRCAAWSPALADSPALVLVTSRPGAGRQRETVDAIALCRDGRPDRRRCWYLVITASPRRARRWTVGRLRSYGIAAVSSCCRDARSALELGASCLLGDRRSSALACVAGVLVREIGRRAWPSISSGERLAVLVRRDGGLALAGAGPALAAGAAPAYVVAAGWFVAPACADLAHARADAGVSRSGRGVVAAWSTS